MKIGISRPYADPGHPKPDVDMGLICQFAEKLGFEWACYGHHTVRPLEEPVKPPHFGVPLYQDPLIGAARALAMTERFEISTAVLIMPMQHPVTVAKQVATIDCYAPGRFKLGLGTGGASRLEIELSGGSFERRWEYTMESIQVMKGLWTEESFTFEGEFFRFPPTLLGPRPATKPHPPVWLGGFSDKVLRRIGEHCEGWLPVYHNDHLAFGTDQHGPTNARESRAKMHRFAEEAGRTVERFEIAAIMTPESDLDAIWQYRDAGVDRIAVTLPEVDTFDEARHALENIARTLKLG
jgi:probable F420-dependent oxidoreductase